MVSLLEQRIAPQPGTATLYAIPLHKEKDAGSKGSRRPSVSQGRKATAPCGTSGQTGWRIRSARGASALTGLEGTVFGVGLRRTDQQLFLDDVLGTTHQTLDLVGHVRVCLQEIADIVAALADALGVEREPGA